MLDHFVAAQEPVFETVLTELRAGRKRTHWMWFIFPQIAGLGFSSMSQRFALHSLDEAKDYFAHPVLGPRLLECTEAVLAHEGRDAHQIFGSPDDLKLCSSMTLFHRAVPDAKPFRAVLDRFFDGREDAATLARI